MASASIITIGGDFGGVLGVASRRSAKQGAEVFSAVITSESFFSRSKEPAKLVTSGSTVGSSGGAGCALTGTGGGGSVSIGSGG